MLFLTKLFPRNCFLLKRGARRYGIYAGKGNPVQSISSRQFDKAYQFSLIREEKTKKGKSTGIWVLDRNKVRALHGRTTLKKLYLKYCKEGSLPIQEEKPIILTTPDFGLFAQETGKGTRTVITEEAMDAIRKSTDCRNELIEFFKMTDRTLRNWLAERSPMLTTPDAVEIITHHTGIAGILKKIVK